MTEFRGNSADLRGRTMRRVTLELTALGILLASVLLGLVTAIPIWLQWAAVAAVLIYILAGVALYSRARAIAESLTVRLDDQGLTFAYAGGGGDLRYSDMKISRVRKDGDRLVEILLVARSGQAIKLRGLDNMNELYRLLSARVTS
jgi:hypothetical protein